LLARHSGAFVAKGIKPGILIGVGRTGSAGSPSLRTGLADLPHPALQSVESTSGLADGCSGCERVSIPRTTTGPQPHLAPYRGRQHAFDPCPRFGPWVSPKVLSAGSSPSGHLRRFPVRSHGLHASTFLPPFAPRPLRRFFATMGALTPQRLTRPLGSPRLPRAAFPPFRLQPPREPLLSLYHATRHRRRFTGFPPDSGFATR